MLRERREREEALVAVVDPDVIGAEIVRLLLAYLTAPADLSV